MNDGIIIDTALRRLAFSGGAKIHSKQTLKIKIKLFKIVLFNWTKMQNKKSIFFAKYLEIAPTTEHAQLYVLEPHILHILNVWWTVVGLLVFSFLIKQRNPSQNV